MARPSQELVRLRGEVRELEAYCALLKGALLGANIEVPPPQRFLLRGLTPQCHVLVGLLLQAWPGCVHRYDILEQLPGYPAKGGTDPLDRDEKLVGVLVHHVRTHVGFECIENVHGKGYRLSDAFRAELAITREAPPVLHVVA